MATLLNLPFDSPPALPPALLMTRLQHTLTTAMRHLRQFPEPALAAKVPNRDRTCLALANHIVEIAAGYQRVAAGEAFDLAMSAAIPEHELDRADLPRRAETILARLAASSEGPPAHLDQRVETFFGPTTLHAILERCTWHAAQHTRQLAALLEQLGIEAEAPLTNKDLDGLPVPTGIWD